MALCDSTIIKNIKINMVKDDHWGGMTWAEAKREEKHLFT